MDKIDTATLSVSTSEPTSSTPAAATSSLSSSVGLTMSTSQTLTAGASTVAAAATSNFTTASIPAVSNNRISIHVTPLGLARRLSSTPPISIAGPNTTLILRKSKSISFYISLQPTSSTSRRPSIPPFRTSSSRPTADDLARRLTIRQTRANLRRSMHLHDTRLRLRRRAEHIRYRTLLQRQRDRLHSLKVRAQSEYAVSAANLRRELILKTHVERCGKAVEHAQTVAMMHKLKKFLELRRAFSENFKDFLEEGEKEGEYEMDEYEVAVPAYRHSVSGSKEKHANLKSLRGELAALDTASAQVDEDGQIETNTSPRRRAISAPDLRQLSLEDREDDEEEEDTDDQETLVDMIKRLKVIPLELFESVPDDNYIALLPLLPPNITRFTLRELDLSEILSSAQLRHDLYFDPDLKFKLNNDGEAWEVKMLKTNTYWDTLAHEVEVLNETWRIPLLVHEIKGCLRELLPYEEGKVEEVERGIDVELVKQEVEHGVLDVVALVEYVGGVMKATCAPVRDGMVDAMCEEARQGRVVRSLRTCFTVLELMRLDFANDQLHRVRPYVVEHAHDFEWRWFKTHVEAHSLSLDSTRAWLHSALSLPTTPQPFTLTFKSLTNLHIHALLSLVLSTPNLTDTPAPPFPETLRMDTSRLVHLYNDWQDITIMGVLLVLFRQACGGRCGVEDVRKAKRELWVLVNDAGTSMGHVSAHIVREAGRIRGRAFSEEEARVFAGMVESTLNPESKIYSMMQGRVGKLLASYCLEEGGVESGEIVKCGWGECAGEVKDLGERVKKLADFNRGVYGSLYWACLEREEGVLKGVEGSV
ncbi:hypothetical protein HDV00_009698 [Rhizophlyctis rosea]|nr:hypothetical protein HDV00_009698 [Rhizophlyctis rosea]